MRNKSIRSVLIIVGILISAITFAADKMPIKAQNKVVTPTHHIKSIVTLCQTDDKWKDICAYFNKYQLVKYEEALNNKNIEKLLGEVCIGGKEELCEKPIIFTDNLYAMGMQKDDKEFGYLINDRFLLRASLVDVNNDGKDELRIWRRVGSANCEHSYFWKKDANGFYKFIDAKPYDDLAEEGSGCGAHLIFVPHMKSIYTLYIEYNPPDHIPRISEIWKGTESELIRVCSDCRR